MAFQNPLKSRWVAVFIGFLVGVFASSLTRSASSEDEKAETLILKQMLAIENIEKTQGREPSSKAEIDAEVGRWDDYARYEFGSSRRTESLTIPLSSLK
jgi:hypothetical protein